jgi:REP element-mobilizing transposase RayT
MLRGVEKRRIFMDSDDYQNFICRLDRLIPELGFRCFAWALMPNHVHLVVQTGHVPLARLMARLETGYAVYFNRRHERVGHLLQNRYKARLVADDVDLAGLVVYVHRNPLEGGLVAEPEDLGGFPWCGHGALVGARDAMGFESVASSLKLFGAEPREARRELMSRIRRGPVLSDARSENPEVSLPPNASSREREAALNELIRSVCEFHGVSADALGAGRKSRLVTDARAEIARKAVHQLGVPSSRVARAIGVHDSTVSRALRPARRR